MRSMLAGWVFCGIVLLIVQSSQAQRPDERSRQNRRARDDSKALKVGQEAPKFILETLDSESSFDLDSARQVKPVVLIFGSYT